MTIKQILIAAAALLSTTMAEAAPHSDLYTPDIERLYAARMVRPMIEKHCNDLLNYNFDTLDDLDKKANLPGDFKLGMERTKRVSDAVQAHMAATGVKRGMGHLTSLKGNNLCLLILYTFGPNGTWIKGLLKETD